MYRLNGRPVSLYVIPKAGRERGSAEVFGHDAVIWSSANITYVLVGREPRATLEALARTWQRGFSETKSEKRTKERIANDKRDR